jgi:Mg-chelatase subunit ChlD
MHTLFDHGNRGFERDFGPRPPAWDPRRKHAGAERALALDRDPGGDRTLILDAREARLVALPDGAEPPASTPAPPQDERALSPGANEIALAHEARDLAVGYDRRVYVSALGRVVEEGTAGPPVPGDPAPVDTIREVLARNAAPDPVDPRIFPCDCPLGGRIAVGFDRLYVSRPISRETGVLPFRDGPAPALAPPPAETFGLWPADVAVALGSAPGDYPALTADLIAGEVRRWDASGLPAGRWPAGLLAGPRRVTTGHLPDGTTVALTLHTDGYVELHRADDGGLLARFLPTDGEGKALSADDAVLDGSGRILVSDLRTRRIHVFAPDPDAPPDEPTPTPGPSPTPSDGACVVRGDKSALPSRLALGEAVTVTVGLAADCPPRTRLAGADIVLVLDRSGSMYGEPLAKAKEAATAFAGFLDVRVHRAAVVSFAAFATLETSLTDDTAALVRAIDGPEADGGTNLAAALQLAAAHLDAEGRADALPVIVLLTDGEQTEGQADPLETAADLRARGMQLYTVGLGSLIDADALRAMAGDPARYFEAPTPDELFPIYREVLRLVVTSLAGNLIVDDTLASDQPYVAGSARPPALEQPGRLRWGRSLLPAGGITLTYRVRPQRAGLQPVGEAVELRYTDADGLERRAWLPPPEIEVVAPTPTATAVATETASPTPTPRPSATPTATPTRRPVPLRPIYLPALWRNVCLGGDARVDVALVIDISSSMTGTKIDRARAAAATFVDVLFALSLERR